MLTIRLFCAAGMSTSLLVRKMIEAAEAEGTEVDIIAYPVGEFDQHITGIDCALLGPQVGYMKAQMQAKAKAAGVPCDVIPQPCNTRSFVSGRDGRLHAGPPRKHIDRMTYVRSAQ